MDLVMVSLMGQMMGNEMVSSMGFVMALTKVAQRERMNLMVAMRVIWMEVLMARH